VGGLFIVERERRQDDPRTDLVSLVDRETGVLAVGQVGEELAGRRLEALRLERDCRVAKAGRELQREDPVGVDDAVEVDAPDVPLRGQPLLQAPERPLEQFVAAGPEHRGPHFAGLWADVARE